MSRPEDHPNARRLAGFLRADLAPEVEALLRDHLLEGRCLRCLRELHRQLARTPKAAGLRPPLAREERTARLLREARRVEHRAFVEEVELRLAPELLEEILHLAPQRRLEAVRGTWKFHLLGLAAHLAKRAREEVFTDVARALELGSLALEVAEWLDPAVYGRREVAEAQARAWGAVGNAERVAEDFVGAERALAHARRLLASASGDPLLRADVLSLLGSLRMAQTRFDEARAALEEAASIFRLQGTFEDEARVLVKLAKAAGETGLPERAVELCREAVGRLAGSRTPRLRLKALQVQATFLADVGRAQQARAVFEELAAQYRKHPQGPRSELRLAWLDARIAWAEGDPVRAQVELGRVRAGFAERELGYDYALASLDEALLLLEQGRTEEAKRVAAEIFPIFLSHDVHRPALTALLVAQRALEAGEASAALVRDVARYLRRARHNSYLTYEPAA